MIFYAKGIASVKRYRQMLRDLGVEWYCVKGREFVYQVSVKHNITYDITIRLISIETDDGTAALFKLRWPEYLIDHVV